MRGRSRRCWTAQRSWRCRAPCTLCAPSTPPPRPRAWTPAASPASSWTISPAPRPARSGRRAATRWSSCPAPARSTRRSPACRDSSTGSRSSRSTAGCPPPSRTARPAAAAPGSRPGSWSPRRSRSRPSRCPGCIWWSMRGCPARCGGIAGGTCRAWSRSAPRGPRSSSAPAVPPVRARAGRCGCSPRRSSRGCRPSPRRRSPPRTSPMRRSGSPAGGRRAGRACRC